MMPATGQQPSLPHTLHAAASSAEGAVAVLPRSQLLPRPLLLSLARLQPDQAGRSRMRPHAKGGPAPTKPVAKPAAAAAKAAAKPAPRRAAAQPARLLREQPPPQQLPPPPPPWMLWLPWLFPPLLPPLDLLPPPPLGLDQQPPNQNEAAQPAAGGAAVPEPAAQTPAVAAEPAAGEVPHAAAKPGPASPGPPLPPLPHTLLGDHTISRSAAAVTRVRAGGVGRTVLPVAPPEQALTHLHDPIGTMGAFVSIVSSGSAEQCGVRVGDAPADAAVAVPVIQDHRGRLSWSPIGHRDGGKSGAKKNTATFGFLAGMQMDIGGAAKCAPLDMRTALNPTATEAAALAAGRLPVLPHADVLEPISFNVGTASDELSLADTGRLTLRELSKAFVLARRVRVGENYSDAAKKYVCLVAWASVQLQVLATLVVLCTLAGMAREAAGLPVRSRDEAVRAVASLLPLGADLRDWVAVLLPGGVALPMPVLLRDALLRVLDGLAAGPQPAEATTGATGLGFEHFGL
jgi:hypothetical protein